MQSDSRKFRQYPFKRHLKRKTRRIIFMLVATALASGITYYQKHLKTVHQDTETSMKASTFEEVSKIDYQQATNKIKAERKNTHAYFWVGFNAKVVQLLDDDLTESRHQSFIVRLDKDITLILAHNINVSSRTPIKR